MMHNRCMFYKKCADLTYANLNRANLGQFTRTLDRQSVLPSGVLI
jgi:hypothetical protein